MPQTKNEKRKGALERMMRGKNPNTIDNRVKKYPRTEERRLEEIEHLKKLINFSY